jgi:hypothetical protein
MKRQIITIGLAIVALLLVLLPRIGYSQTPVSAVDSPCFYRQADGTIVDLRSICGERSPSTPLPGRIVPSGNGAIPPSPSTRTIRACCIYRVVGRMTGPLVRPVKRRNNRVRSVGWVKQRVTQHQQALRSH